MAVLIQPVQGFEFNGSFLPGISGTAYTSFHGLPLVRVVVGLATKAVLGEGITYTTPPKDWLSFQRANWDQKTADMIDLSLGEVSSTHPQFEEIFSAIYDSFGSFQDFFDKLTSLKSKGDFYVEWVAVGDSIQIIQCAPHSDRLPGKITFDPSQYFLLLETKDTANVGQVSCSSIVFADRWTTNTAGLLEDLNRKMKGFLLIVPQDALSRLADIHENEVRLRLRHFSNAMAVVEKQWSYSKSGVEAKVVRGFADHSAGRGAYHFQQLCDRLDILFLGGDFDVMPLWNLVGIMEYRRGTGLYFWEVPVEVIVGTEEEGGFVYVSNKPRVNKYEPSQVEEWSFALRNAALDTEKNPATQRLSECFYLVHYAIAPDTNPLGYNPFRLQPDIVEESGIAEIILSIQTVLQEGENFVGNKGEGVEIYLQELLDHLTK